MSSRLKILLLGAASVAALVSPAAAEDWSGWWGGGSLGGAYTGFDSSRMSDGSAFCIVEATGGASASCQVGDDYARIYTNHEMGDAFVETRQEYADGEAEQSGSFGNVEPPMQANYSISYAIGPLPQRPVVMNVSSGLESPSGSSQARGVAMLNIFDFGAVPDLSSGSFALGGHVRRDWQTEKGWVVGVEAEVSALLGSGDSWSGSDVYQPNEFFEQSASQSVSVDPQGLGSLRLRVGRDMGSWMPYVTGGLGIGWFKAGLSKSFEETIFDTVSGPVPISSSETAREVLFSGVIGAGVQHRLNEVITLSGELLYYRFTGDLGFSDTQSIGVDDSVSVTFKLSTKLN